MEERPYSSRLKKIGALLGQNSVTREEVVCELGGYTPTPVIFQGPGLRGELGVVSTLPLLPEAAVTVSQPCGVLGPVGFLAGLSTVPSCSRATHLQPYR